MSGATIRKRWIMLALAALLALVLGLGATLAWQSNTHVRLNSFQNVYLPNANLHDDYIAPEGDETYTLRPNKDVYVENSGNRPVYLRVRLTEYLETQKRGSLVAGQQRDEATANQWTPHNSAGSVVGECSLPPEAQVSHQWEGEHFHDYYQWVMGGTATPEGQIYYKPATKEQQGDYDADGNLLREPIVVTDPNAGLGPHYNPAQLYAQQVQEQQEQGSTEAEAMAAKGLKKTLPTQIITMQDWVNGNPERGIERLAIGSMWVIDEKDGWCYWASPLRADEATGLLLDGVQRTDKPFDSTAEYCINVVLQAVDLDDIGKLWSAITGGATVEGETLLKIISGQLVLGEDNWEYINNGDGSYRRKNPEVGQDSRSFVPLVVPSVNAPDRLYFGQRFTVDELLWNGDDYTNWQTVLTTTTQPLYNITCITDAQTEAVIASGIPVYQLIGSDIGMDGNVYLQIVHMEKNPSTAQSDPTQPAYLPSNSYCYLGSINAEPKSLAVLADPWENPEAKHTYSRVYPGKSPYAFLWQDASGEIILPKNPDTSIGGRYFHQLGSGVYVEVAAAGETVSKDTPVKYYFARKVLTKTVLDAIHGEGDAKVNNVFPLQMVEGERFNATFRVNVTEEKSYLQALTPTEAGKYPLGVDDRPIIAGTAADGLSIPLQGTNSVIDPGVDNLLGTADDVQVWLGRDKATGGSDNSYTGDFSETFLYYLGINELDVGKTIKLDGWDWVVLTIDGNGNRLFMTTTRVESMGARSITQTGESLAYARTDWPARATAFVNTLANLKPCARTATLPIESSYSDVTQWIGILPTGGQSVAGSGGGTGFLAFPLSAGEHVKYIVNSSNATIKTTYHVVKDKDGVVHNSGLRSLNRTRINGTYRVMAFTIGIGGAPLDAYGDSLYPPRMAMWVRLSDAESIATATPAELAVRQSPTTASN